MAIPDKPLELAIEDPENLTFDDLTIFDVEEAQENPFQFINRVRRFMMRYCTSWTPEEIKALTVGEVETLSPMLMEALNTAFVPKVSMSG